jgi:hypothetical protein
MWQSVISDKRNILILSTVLLIVLIIFLYVFATRKSTDRISLSLPNTSSPLSVKKKQEIATETTKHIMSQRRGDNYYTYMSHYDSLCVQKNGTKVCPFNNQNVYETTNAWTSLSHLAEYQLTRDKSSLEQSKQDMNILMEWCKDRKEKCRWVLVQAVRLYDETKDPRLLSFLDDMADHMVTVSQTEEIEPMLTSIEVRELTMIYALTKKQKYLDDAKSKLRVAYNQLQSQDKNIYVRHPFPYSTHSCWYFLAENEIGKADKNTYYTNRVKQFLENGDIYNFGSNPLLSHVIDVPSYMEFVDAVHALCVERGREIDDEMSLGKIGNIGD